VRSWLSERMPLINQVIDDASLLPTCDNLYLDLNGTIHNATHGDGASRKLEMKDVRRLRGWARRSVPCGPRLSARSLCRQPPSSPLRVVPPSRRCARR